MMKVHHNLFSLLAIALLSCAWPLHGEEKGQSRPDHVEDLSLSVKDIEGNSLTPFQLGNSPGTVLLFVTHDCPISNAYSPELARIREDFIDKGFRLMLIYVDPDVTPEEIRKHMKDFSLQSYTAVQDSKHILVKQTGADITPEAVVVLPDATIAYRGRIDNMYPALGKRRRVITRRELRDALDAILANRTVEVSRTKAIGCFIPRI